MPRESELDRQWKELVVQNDASLNERVHKLELKIAILEVRQGFVSAGIAASSSIVTTLVVAAIVHFLKLK